MARCIKKDINVGNFDKLVSIEKIASTARVTGGALTRTWAERTTAWMEIRPLTSGEEYKATQLELKTTHKGMMRYQSGVISKDRVVWDSRYFSIIGIKDLEERKAFLELDLIETDEAAEDG